jgi:hypothetical protein
MKKPFLGVILSVTWACGLPIGMKKLFLGVILSDEVAAATEESKDPYTAHSLSPDMIFDGAGAFAFPPRGLRRADAQSKSLP